MAYTLEVLFRLLGIGAASGLAYCGELLYVISDDSAYLYEYRIADHSLTRIVLAGAEVMEDIPKAKKFDFEAITVHDGNVYAFGSGSTQNRNVMARVRKGKADITDLSNFYGALRKKSGIPDVDFNIEGAAFHDDRLYLLQRGNGPLSHNGIFVCDADFSGRNIAYYSIPIPSHDGNVFGFTDMAIHGGKIYFTAAAEKVLSTYLDGEIAGSLFGVIDLQTLRIEKTVPLGNAHKFEGIAFYSENPHEMQFLLCEDRDAKADAAEIYRLAIKK